MNAIVIAFPGVTLPTSRNLAAPGRAPMGGEYVAGRKTYLTSADVGRLWGEERAKAAGEDPATAQPITTSTVSAYLRDSRPGSGGRYEGHPIPEPVYSNDSADRRGQIPHWVPGPKQTLADVERELRAWYRDRPKGTTTGRPRWRYSDEDILRVRQLAGQGKTDTEIGQEVGITAKAVAELRSRNNIPAGVAARRARRSAK